MEGSAPAGGGAPAAAPSAPSTPSAPSGDAPSLEPSNGATGAPNPTPNTPPADGSSSSKPAPEKSPPKSKEGGEGAGSVKEAAGDVAETTGPDAEMITQNVEGRDVTKSRKEWMRIAQKGLGADKKFERAAQMRKEAEAERKRALAILEARNSDPLSLFEPASLEKALMEGVHSTGPVRDAIEKVLHYALEDSRKPDEVRQKEAAERRAQEVQMQAKRQQQQRRRFRNDTFDRAIGPHYKKAAMQALEEAGFPVEGEAGEYYSGELHRMARGLIGKWKDELKLHDMEDVAFGGRVQELAIRGIPNLPEALKHLTAVLSSQQTMHTKSALSRMDGEALLAQLGDEGLGKIRELLKTRAQAKKAEKAKAALEPNGEPAPRKAREEKREVMSPEAYLEKRRRERGQ